MRAVHAPPVMDPTSALLAALPLGAIALGPNGRCVAANEIAAEMLGCEIVDLLHKDFRALGWWRESGLLRREREVVATGAPFDARVRVSPSPGRTLYLQWHIHPLESPEGAGALVTFEDAGRNEPAEQMLALTRLSIDRAADLIHWVAPDGSLLYVSDSNCDRHGYTREELLALTIFDLDPDMTPETWAEHWRDLQAAGTITLEANHRTKTGELFPLEIIANFVEHEGGQYNFAYARDISARKDLEESLRRTQFSVEKAADYIFWIDSDGALVYVNESTCARLGYSRDELLSMTVFDVDPYASREWAARWRQIKQRGAETFETVHETKDGEVFPVEVSTNHHEFGGREYQFVFSRDITTRKRAEEALRLSERLLAEAQVVANLGSYTLDIPSGLWTSSAMLDVLFGIGDAYDRSVEGWLDLIHPDDRLMMSEYLRQEVLGRGEMFDKEYRIIRGAEQDVRWVHGRGRLERDDAGHLATMFGTIQDITERRQAEEALRESEERLRQSQRLEALGSLAGGIAHDFNNLLTAIIGQTEILRSGPHLSPESQEGLSEIRAAADRAATLTRQLLAFSRRQPLQPRSLNVNEVARSMTGLLERVLGEDVTLEFREERVLWPVEADPGQLEQVIVNLAVNARDAMPQGGRLTIETSNVELESDRAAARIGIRPGAYVRLAVADSGCGMDEDTLGRAFEPFFTTKDPAKGTGLGLSTVYGIVKQSGGGLNACSRPGEGSTFEIYLPRARKPVDWSPADHASPADPGRQGTETILVVEDEPAVLRLTTRILKACGYHVLAACSPAEAIAIVDHGPASIDLVLSDVILPGMSGRTLVETILDRLDTPPKVVYMSGYPRDAIVHDGRLDEGLAFLEKPFTPEHLSDFVREVLDSPR